jgi:Protein of unknown function (DUF2586)
MALPNVGITRIDTSFSSLTGAKDGITILVVSAPTAYTSTITAGDKVFLNLQNAEDTGITKAKDLSNNTMLWEHIKDFFALAEGTELHLYLVPADTTLVNLFTPSNVLNIALKNYLADKSGIIKMLGVALNPDYAETHTTSISTDLLNAIPFAQTFATEEYGRNRPLDIVLEGRKFAGTAALATNLRLLNSGNVSVTITRDKIRKTELVTAGHTGGVANYAQVGLLLGKIASVMVARNAGRVLSGALPVISGELSGGQTPYNSLNETDLNAINDKGYIFYVKYPTLNGWFINNDHTCQLTSKSSSRIAFNRVANKASRIAISVYVLYLKDEIKVNASNGTLDKIKVLQLESDLERAIKQEMFENPDPTREAEISSVKVKIDPAQNVLATGKIVATLKIVPLGCIEAIETVVSLINPNQS